MHLTAKQQELIRVVVAANPDGSPCDLDQILERLSYGPTKESLQFSIRALIRHELIEKKGSEVRRDRRRVLIVPTEMGKHFAAPRPAPSFISSEVEEEILADVEEYLLP